jgi:hypothetical protein
MDARIRRQQVYYGGGGDDTAGGVLFAVSVPGGHLPRRHRATEEFKRNSYTHKKKPPLLVATEAFSNEFCFLLFFTLLCWSEGFSEGLSVRRA